MLFVFSHYLESTLQFLKKYASFWVLPPRASVPCESVSRFR